MYDQPVFQSIRGRYGNNRWQAPSIKLNRQVNLSSNLEYDYWVIIETDPNVIRFCEQPIRIALTQGDRVNHSILDFWELFANREEQFVEVKYSFELDPNSPFKSERSIKQTALQKEWCGLNGYKYTIVIEREIYSNPQSLTNKKRILFLARKTTTDEDIRFIQEIIEKGPLTIREVVEQGSPELQLRMYVAVAHMYLRGLAGADLETCDFGPETKISMPSS